MCKCVNGARVHCSRLREMGVPEGVSCDRAMEFDQRRPSEAEVKVYFTSIKAGAPCDRALQKVVLSRSRRSWPI